MRSYFRFAIFVMIFVFLAACQARPEATLPVEPEPTAEDLPALITSITPEEVAPVVDAKTGKVSVLFSGYMGACETLNIVVSKPDENNRINAKVYTVNENPEQVCIEIALKFDKIIELGTLTPGEYSILVNDTDQIISFIVE